MRRRAPIVIVDVVSRSPVSFILSATISKPLSTQSHSEKLFEFIYICHFATSRLYYLFSLFLFYIFLLSTYYFLIFLLAISCIPLPTYLM